MAPAVAPDKDVLGHREVGEEGGLLIDHRDARGLAFGNVPERHRLSIDPELAGVEVIQASEDLDEGGLARTVLADQGVDFAREDVDRSVREGDDRTECLDRRAEGQARFGGIAVGNAGVTCNGDVQASTVR